MAAKTKPGWQTSEFLITVATQIPALFIAGDFFPESHWSVKLAAFVASLATAYRYIGSREAVKATK